MDYKRNPNFANFLIQMSGVKPRRRRLGLFAVKRALGKSVILPFRPLAKIRYP